MSVHPWAPSDRLESVDVDAVVRAVDAILAVLERHPLPGCGKVGAALMAAATVASFDEDGWSYAAFASMAVDALEQTQHGPGHPESVPLPKRTP